MPSDADPYSPEIVCGRVRVDTGDKGTLPPSLNSSRVIGDAVSSPPDVLSQIVAPTEQETVLMTRSPGVNSAAALCGAAKLAKSAADENRALRNDGRTIGMTAPRLHHGNYSGDVSRHQCHFRDNQRLAGLNFCLLHRIYDDWRRRKAGMSRPTSSAAVGRTDACGCSTFCA